MGPSLETDPVGGQNRENGGTSLRDRFVDLLLVRTQPRLHMHLVDSSRTLGDRDREIKKDEHLQLVVERQPSDEHVGVELNARKSSKHSPIAQKMNSSLLVLAIKSLECLIRGVHISKEDAG